MQIVDVTSRRLDLLHQHLNLVDYSIDLLNQSSIANN
jgi:hypothetical protein